MDLDLDDFIFGCFFMMIIGLSLFSLWWVAQSVGWWIVSLVPAIIIIMIVGNLSRRLMGIK